jgi:hypothetical protein
MKKKMGRPSKPPDETATVQFKSWLTPKDYALWHLALRDDLWNGDFSGWVKHVISVHIRDKRKDGWAPPEDPIAAARAIGIEIEIKAKGKKK